MNNQNKTKQNQFRKLEQLEFRFFTHNNKKNFVVLSFSIVDDAVVCCHELSCFFNLKECIRHYILGKVALLHPEETSV